MVVLRLKITTLVTQHSQKISAPLRLCGSLLLLVLAVPTQVASAQPADTPTVDQRSHQFQRGETRTFKAPYLIALPDGYGKDTTKRWPLILFLHSADVRGDDPAALTSEGLPYLIQLGRKLPFVVVSPQCPAGEWWDSRWEVETVAALLDEIEADYAVDPDRVYLTGWSMGGSGVWRLAALYPNRFAALAPICGIGRTEDVISLKSLPAWVFHGADDPVVPPAESRKMVDALTNAGADVHFTLLDKTEHDAWRGAYADNKLFDWFLTHKRTAH